MSLSIEKKDREMPPYWLDDAFVIFGSPFVFDSFVGAPPLSSKDFQPSNQWEQDSEGPKWKEYELNSESSSEAETKEPKYIVDLTTHNRYLNESPNTLRIKHGLLLFGVPLFRSIETTIKLARLVSFYHFWATKNLDNCNFYIDAVHVENGVQAKQVWVNDLYKEFCLSLVRYNSEERAVERANTLKGRVNAAKHDLLDVTLSPFAITACEIAALYGLFAPQNGRKLFASIERLSQKSFLMAPCFQPNARFHFFGGDINKKNTF